MRTHRSVGGPPTLGLIAAALVLLFSAAACTDDSPDPRDPTSTWSPTGTIDPPSPTATPTEPELPDAATQPDEDGARAFITYYWDLINYAQVTGDVKALKAASGPNCTGCQAGIRGIKEHYGSGGSIVGGAHQVERATVTEVTSASDIYAFRSEARVTHGAQTIVSSDGAEEPRQPGADEWDLYILWVDDARWRLDVMELK